MKQLIICLYVTLLLYLKLFKCSATNNLILKGPPESDQLPGFWGPWEMCDQGTYVMGFKVKSENSRIVRSQEFETGDTFGLSGVELICGLAGNRSHTKGISSNVAAEGEWAGVEFCEGYTVGFQVKLMDDKKGGDSVGATNLRMQCSARGNAIGPHLEYQPGEWSDPEFCHRNQAVCGIRTKTKLPFDDDDLVGVSTLRLKCCDFHSQSITCFPTDGFELLFDFDNTMGLQPVTYSYSMTVGVSKVQSKNQGHNKQKVGQGNLGVEYQVGNASREVDGRRRRRREIQTSSLFKQSPPIVPGVPTPAPTPNPIPNPVGMPFPVQPPNPLPPNLNPIPGFPPGLPAPAMPVMPPSDGMNPVMPPVMPPVMTPVMPPAPGAMPGQMPPAAVPPAPAAPGNDQRVDQNTDILRIYSLNAQGSLTSGYNWGTSSSSTWAPSRTTRVSVTIRPGHSVSIYQVVGVCGDWIVRPEKIFQNGTSLDKNAKMAKVAIEGESFGGYILYITNFLTGISSVLQDFFNIFKKFSETLKLFSI